MTFHYRIVVLVACCRRALPLIAVLFLPVTGHVAAADLDVQQFLKQHCSECHHADSDQSDFSLSELQRNLTAESAATADRWRWAANRLRAGEMPPPEAKQPAPAEVEQALDVIRQRLADFEHAAQAAGKPITERHAGSLAIDPTGNRLPHALLFGTEPSGPSAGPARLWRASPHIYQRLTAQIDKRLTVPQVFTPAEGDFSDFADGATVDEPGAQQLLRNALALVEAKTQFNMEDGELHGDNWPPNEFKPLFDLRKEPTIDEINSAIRQMFRMALRRNPTEGELQRFVKLYEDTTATAGREDGSRLTLATVCLLPEAVFRLELGKGPVDEYGRIRLSPREIAFALSFALTDDPPSDDLLRAADAGEFDTRAGVAQRVEKMFSDPKLDRPRLLRFFREYFGYDQAVEVFKDRDLFKPHRPDVLVSDTDQLVLKILAEDKNVLRELLTTNRSFVNYKDDRKKGPSRARNEDVRQAYNLEKWEKNQPLKLPGQQRMGVLTQPSWLVAYSTNFDNHAILRGRWVREKLLGGTVPDLPITVDAQLPDDPEQTLRERMQVTRDQYCWQCHRQMNPLGLPFEQFDHFGRYRETELDKPVETAGTVDFTGDAKLDGPVEDPFALIKRLAESDRVRQVFVRHVFRYFMGRDETLRDAATLQAADQAYVNSGGSFKALVTSLLSSDSFLYRQPLVPPDAEVATGQQPPKTNAQ